MVGVATTTIVAVGAAVVEVGEARRVLVVAQDAAKGVIRVSPTEAVAAALGEAPEGGGTLHELVQRGVARAPPPVRLRAREGSWRGDRGSRQEVSNSFSGEYCFLP